MLQFHYQRIPPTPTCNTTQDCAFNINTCTLEKKELQLKPNNFLNLWFDFKFVYHVVLTHGVIGFIEEFRPIKFWNYPDFSATASLSASGSLASITVLPEASAVRIDSN